MSIFIDQLTNVSRVKMRPQNLAPIILRGGGRKTGLFPLFSGTGQLHTELDGRAGAPDRKSGALRKGNH